MDLAAQDAPLAPPVLELGMRREFDAVHEQTDYILREDRPWSYQHQTGWRTYRRYFIHGTNWPLNENDTALNVSAVEHAPVLFEVRESVSPCSTSNIAIFRKNIDGGTPWPDEPPLLHWKEEPYQYWASDKSYLMSGNNEQIGYSVYPGMCSWDRRSKVFDFNGDLHYTLAKTWCASNKLIVHRRDVPVGFIRKMSPWLWEPGKWFSWFCHGEENLTAVAFLQDESFVGRLLLLRELVVHGRAFEGAKQEEIRRRRAAEKND